MLTKAARGTGFGVFFADRLLWTEQIHFYSDSGRITGERETVEPWPRKQSHPSADLHMIPQSNPASTAKRCASTQMTYSSF